MTVIHKKNGGYIGVDYKQPFPSGVHVIGGVGRVVDVEVDVELYGGKGDDYLIWPDGLDPNSPSRKGGNGGYTKFRITAPSSKTLQIRPAYVNGNDPVYQRGGDGAAVLIADQWLGVVGGGGGAGGRVYYDTDINQFLTISVNPGGAGQGGYGTGTPSNGASGSGCSYSDASYFGSSESGNGGGGAPGGTSGGTGCYGSPSNPGPYGGGGGGGGNLRIYKDQSVTSGYLSILPDVYMSYTTHTNGSHNGSPQVKLTNVATGASYTYTGSSDIKTVYIKDGEFNP